MCCVGWWLEPIIEWGSAPSMDAHVVKQNAISFDTKVCTSLLRDLHNMQLNKINMLKSNEFVLDIESVSVGINVRVMNDIIVKNFSQRFQNLTLNSDSS